jgi:demethylmenaquinone methyltransferase/2-methoxy-6-polyprenyl-1,4-benzoquinol methylase
MKALLKRENGGPDAHALPYPDNHFDFVSLQYASRHLAGGPCVLRNPPCAQAGGRFHHCDILRPGKAVAGKIVLRLSLAFTGFLFRSGPAALEWKRNFVSTLALFYSAEELTGVLTSLGYRQVSRKTIPAGMIGCSSAAKPA